MSKFVDLSGHQFGRLTAIGRLPSRRMNDGRWRIFWNCLCECKTKTIVESSKLSGGTTRSCGCLKIETAAKQLFKHGHAVHNSDGSRGIGYTIWQNMISRCTNSKNPSFKNYGRRGISVCKRWLDFRNFILDMGAPPFMDSSIDRIDNNGNYKPKNCRWLPLKENRKWRRCTNAVFIDGKRMTGADAAKTLGISQPAMSRRAKKLGSYQAAVDYYLTKGGNPCLTSKNYHP